MDHWKIILFCIFHNLLFVFTIICITICSKENIFSKIGSYSSKVSADYIMDVIFALLFKNISVYKHIS